MIQDNFKVSMIMNDSELRDGGNIIGDNVKGDCVVRGGGGGIEG